MIPSWLYEPLWLAYPVAALVLLTALFAWSVRWWLAAFPVPELNYSYERKYEKPKPVSWNPTPGIMMATATSAVAYIHQPVAVYDPSTHRVVRR